MYKRLVQDLIKMQTQESWSGAWDWIPYKLKDSISATDPGPYSGLIFGLLAIDVKIKKFKGEVIINIFS